MDKLRVLKTALRIIIDDESCDTFENASLLLKRIEYDIIESASARDAKQEALTEKGKQRVVNSLEVDDEKRFQSSQRVEVSSSAPAKNNLARATVVSSKHQQSSNQQVRSAREALPARASNELSKKVSSSSKSRQTSSSLASNTTETVRALCDEIVRDSISSCQDPDYKMELSKLLSIEAKFQLYIELGELSNAQMLAFKTNRPDYVARIIEEAERLNQTHIKTLCELWIAKH